MTLLLFISYSSHPTNNCQDLPLEEHLLPLPFQPPAPFSLFAQAFVYTLLDLLYLFLLLRVVVSLPLLLLDVYALPTMAILGSQQETDQYLLFYSIKWYFSYTCYCCLPDQHFVRYHPAQSHFQSNSPFSKIRISIQEPRIN